jgi:hypothetical protein
MSFSYSFTFPMNGPNKLPRFKNWAAENAKDIPLSLPPQVPVKSESLTIRLKSVADREALGARLASAQI